MNAYELAKAQQAYSSPTLEEIIKQQADRIAELEKQTKQTPDGLIDPKSYYIGYADGKKAPQLKPLSDEEVIKIRQATKAKSTENWADTLAFARAIEEAHGIK